MQFLKIFILQGSVATLFGCGEIFNERYIANSPYSVPVKEFSKMINI